jgi:hypothetical protein
VSLIGNGLEEGLGVEETGRVLGRLLFARNVSFPHYSSVSTIDSTVVAQPDMAHHSHSLSGKYEQSEPSLKLSVHQQRHSQPTTTNL